MSAQSQECEFYDYSSVMAILGIGRTKAYELLDELEAQGKIVRIGKKKLVRRIVFYQHLAAQDGYMPHDLRTADHEAKKGNLKILSGSKRGESK